MASKKPRVSGETESASSPPRDVALIHGVTPDGQGFNVLRARDNRLELGAIRPLREGVPITGEVVTLRPRADFPALCDVETHLAAPPSPAPEGDPKGADLAVRSGPAQVATDDYRRNWDAIWARAAEKPKLTN